MKWWSVSRNYWLWKKGLIKINNAGKHNFDDFHLKTTDLSSVNIKYDHWSVPFTTACPDCLPRSIVVIICCVYCNSIQNTFLICLFDCSPVLLNFLHFITIKNNYFVSQAERESAQNSKISLKVVRNSRTCFVYNYQSAYYQSPTCALLKICNQTKIVWHEPLREMLKQTSLRFFISALILLPLKLLNKTSTLQAKQMITADRILFCVKVKLFKQSFENHFRKLYLQRGEGLRYVNSVHMTTQQCSAAAPCPGCRPG